MAKIQIIHICLIVIGQNSELMPWPRFNSNSPPRPEKILKFHICEMPKFPFKCTTIVNFCSARFCYNN